MNPYEGNIIYLDEFVIIPRRGQRSNYIEYLRKAGYNTDGDKIEVQPEHLSANSHAQVNVECPNCGERRSARHQTITRKNNSLCHRCSCKSNERLQAELENK